MNGTFKVMGLVQNGRFRLSVPSGRAELVVRLTSISPQAGVPPETGEIDLSPYEGIALMVVGADQGAWIYSAEIIDTAGPILSAVVERLFGQRLA
mgnify:FL=1